MILGIDLWAINYSKNHGIGNYAEQLCRTLLKEYPNNHYVFFSWSKEPICKSIFGEDYLYDEVIIGDISTINAEKAKEIIKQNINKWNIETYLDISPVWGERPNLKHEWFGEKVRLICIAHDLIPYVLRERYYGYRDKDGFIKYIKGMYNLEQYDYIFTNSEYTKKDIIKYVKIDDSRLYCIYCSSGRLKDVNKTEKSSINNEVREVKGRYFLYAAGDAKQKNIPRLLLAYAEAYCEEKNIPNLLITGNYSYRSKELISSISGMYGLEKKIVLTGFVSDEELDYLYDNCEWVLYPSLYEGFGMPVVEAWEHGAPVLTSNNTSLLEIANGAAVLIDPNDTDDLKNGILRITHMDYEERAVYVEEGKKRVRSFTWSNTARLLIDYLLKLPEGGMTNKESSEQDDLLYERIRNEIVEWDRIKKDRGIIEETAEDKNNKSIRYKALLHKWMMARAKRKWLDDFIETNGYKKIALYGFGVMTWHILAELTGNVEVSYIIDQDTTLFHPRYKVVSLKDDLSKVDLVIVTTVNDYDKLRDVLLEKTNSPVVSLEEIISRLISGDLKYEY